MRDRFAALEEPRAKAVGAFLVVLVALGLLFLYQWSGPMRPAIGVVESSGAISVGKIAGGTKETASVRLPNGRLVFATVASGGPLSPGDKVRLIEQRQTLGGVAYEIVAKEPSHEP